MSSSPINGESSYITLEGLDTAAPPESSPSWVSKFRQYLGWIVAVFVGALFLSYAIDKSVSSGSDGGVDVAIFAFNDIYEIKPVGHFGGLARVKTYKNQIEQEFPDGVISVLPGDFFSPSALGTAKYTEESADGTSRSTRLYGKQMVDVLNSIGLDVATYGNHEFDVPYLDFQERLHESKFPYVATNVFSNVDGSKGELFDNTVSSMFITRKNVTFAFIGVVINSNKGTNVEYAQIPSFTESLPLIRAEIDKWKATGQEWDVLVAVTHLNLDDDVRLAENIPEIDLILGGHEHQNWYINRGDYQHPLIISKADSNVKTVFTHRMKFYHNRVKQGDRFGTARQNPGAWSLQSELYTIDDNLPDDKVVANIVDKWWQIAKRAFENTGMDIDRVMAYLPFAYDATEKTMRHQSPSDFGAFMAESFYNHTLTAEIASHSKPLFAFFNSGSIRIDDKLNEGILVEYDVLRVLPFGGDLRLVSTTGARLAYAFAHGLAKPGNGSWMVYSPRHLKCGTNVNAENYQQCSYWSEQDQAWLPFEADKVYTFATVDFVVNGGDDYFPIDPETNTRDYLQILETNFDMTLQQALRDSFEAMFPIPADYQRLKRQTGSVIFKGI